MADSISHLFLDIGGVLLTNGWDRHMRRQAASTFKLDYDEMDERHHLTFGTYEEGKLTLDEYLERVVFYEPRAFSRDEFLSFMYDQSKPYTEMIDYITGLKARHKLKVATVSNEGRELTEYRIRKFGLHRFVDFFVSSCFVHFRKPDEDIWRVALDISQAEPGHVVFVDDRMLFVQIAEGLHLKAIHHTGLEATRRALEGFGIS